MNRRRNFSGGPHTAGQRMSVVLPPKIQTASRGKNTMFVAAMEMGVTSARSARPPEKILSSMREPFDELHQLPPMVFPVAEHHVHAQRVRRQRQAPAGPPAHGVLLRHDDPVGMPA